MKLADRDGPSASVPAAEVSEKLRSINDIRLIFVEIPDFDTRICLYQSEVVMSVGEISVESLE